MRVPLLPSATAVASSAASVAPSGTTMDACCAASSGESVDRICMDGS